jgi:hypothetical protein
MKVRKLSLIVVAFSVALGISISALASSTTKTLKQVEYRNTTLTPDLLLQTSDGINYQATATLAPGCSVLAPSIDTVKIWASLGQAALLAGKNVQIYYTTCNSTNWIQDVILIQ